MQKTIKELELRERQAREALMDAEDRINDILESTTDGFISLDDELKILYLNQSAEEMLKIFREDVLGKKLYEAFPNTRDCDFEAKYHKSLEKNEELSFETYLQGESYQGWYEIKIHPRQEGFSIFFRSINQRKKEEKEIKDREKEYREIIENDHPSSDLLKKNKEQKEVVKLGQIALKGLKIHEIIEKTVEIVCEILKPDFVKILQLCPSGEELLLVAGAGWKKGLVGKARVSNDKNSQAGYTIQCSQPVLVNDLSQETRFNSPEILKQHHICSGVSIIIGALEDPWGILAVHSQKKNVFSQDDADFLQSIAFILGAAIEQKKIEELMKNKEKKYRLLAENATDMISTHDEQGAYTYVSPSCKALLGYSPKELLHQNAYDFIHPQDIDFIQKIHLETLNDPNPHTITYRLLKKDHKYVWVESTSRSVLDPEKENLKETIVITRDVSERIKAEAILKESENYYRTIFENTGTATIIIEEDKTISMVNGEFEKLYGTDRENIEGKMKWPFFVHPHDVDRMVEYHQQRGIDPNSVPRNYEFKFIDHFGNEKQLFATIALIPGTKQRVVSLLDVTAEKHSKNLLEWELEVNQSLNEVYAPLISADSGINEIASNILCQAVQLTGSKVGFVGEIMPKNREMVILSMIPSVPEHIPHKKPILKLDENGIYGGLMGHSLNKRQGFFTNDVSQHNSYKRQPSSHLPINRFLSVPVLLGQEVVGQISLSNPEEDYTKKHLNAVKRLASFYALAIQRMRAEQKVADSLQEKKVLLREIHHRVKNNLQIISSLLNLQSRFITDPEAREVFKESQGRVRSMAFIHEKLYRSESLDNIEFSSYVKRLLDSLIQTYTPRSGLIRTEIDIENISLNIETAIPCGLIINELVSNSLKHAFDSDEEGEISIKMSYHDENYQIIITDNGKGFPSDVDFKQTKSLGLQLVNSLVRQLDGDIELYNHQGSCFKINFQELDYKNRI